MNEFLEEVRAEYEKRQDYKINPSRLRENVEHKAAISNAVRPFSTFKEIGKLFDMNHSSIVHYSREHLGLMQWSPAYRFNYGIAMACVKKVSTDMDVIPLDNRYMDGHKQLKQLDSILEWVTDMREQVIEKLDGKYNDHYICNVEDESPQNVEGKQDN